MDREKLFRFIDENKEKVSELDEEFWNSLCEHASGIYYNWEIKAVDGRVFWKSIDLDNGWSIQTNEVTYNCRILDDKRKRRCYGPRKLVLEPIAKEVVKKCFLPAILTQ